MDEVRKKVLLDLFAAPSTLLPIAGGLTLLMAAWAMGGNSTASFAGLMGVLTGVGLFATRLILGLEKITNRAYHYVVDKRRREQEARLDRLRERLERDNDPRNDACLAELRQLYATLESKVDQGDVGKAPYEVLESVEGLFRTCVHQLEQSADLWESARRLPGAARQSLLEQREIIIREVSESVVHLAQLIDRFLKSKTDRNRSDLRRLRSELEAAIDVARRAEERTAEWERQFDKLPE